MPTITGSPAFAVWLTGLPASGKSTIAVALRDELKARGVHAARLESDALRALITPVPDYSPKERDIFYAALAVMAGLLAENGVPAIVDATAHLRRYRDFARGRIPRFCEVFVATPLASCLARDPKGIYARALAAGHSEVPGLHAPYETPLAPEVVIPDGATATAGAGQIISWLQSQHWL